MGNTVKSSSQGREIVHTENSDQMAKQHRKQKGLRKNEIINVKRSGDVREVENDNVPNESAESNSKTQSESAQGNHRETDNDSTPKAKHSDVVLKMTSQNTQDTQCNQGKLVQETPVRAKELPLNGSEKQSNGIKRRTNLSQSLQNAKFRDNILHSACGSNIKDRAKLDTLIGKQKLISRKDELSLVNQDETVVKKSETKSVSYTQMYASPVKRKVEKDSHHQTEPNPPNLTKKLDMDHNKVFLQNTKLIGTRKREVVSDLTFKKNSLSKKSSKHFKVNDNNVKGRIETLSKRQTQSEPVEHNTAKMLIELNIESPQKGVEEKDSEKSTLSRVSEHDLGNELTECSIDIEGGDCEISSSLRSTALDSSLFESESSVVTHTSIEPPRPASRYSGKFLIGNSET